MVQGQTMVGYLNIDIHLVYLWYYKLPIHRCGDVNTLQYHTAVFNTLKYHTAVWGEVDIHIDYECIQNLSLNQRI